MCDTTGGGGAKAGEAALRAVLPPLLEKGLLSTVADVKAVAIGTLMKLTRSAGGTLLAPHLGVLIPALLEATSEMEGHQLNYISTRLGVDNSVQVRRGKEMGRGGRGVSFGQESVDFTFFCCYLVFVIIEVVGTGTYVI